ncbi:hypothetical protein [Pseudomonas mediterranea]|uniref:hypothetical protein n=1 Tax=Pseudomonas mediterranea TaxID=183795 RepID=UPI0006D88A3E|nr:hypothetical protein [Pseudomonas mediterranea]MDU9028689.1 hypothetical protein [Pseudomonas mediterranea]
MFGISKATALQLVKEFRIPFVVATAWTTYAVWGPEVSFKSFISTFGTSFFLASWMTGQIFRVRKQAGVENSLSQVQSRIELVTEQLEKQTKQLIGHVTGGDSFVYFKVIAHGDDSSTWMATHGGDDDYPVYRAKATIVDLDIFDATVALGRADEADTHVSIGDLLPQSFRIIRTHDLGDVDARSFNIFMTAGNGRIQQKLRMRRVNDGWVQATRVNNNSGVVLLEIDDGYPRNAAGEVCWD